MSAKQTDNYQKAMEELQEILSQLEREEITVDQLAEKVERASLLLKQCEDRLKSTEEKVKKIIGGES
jgi:exodeoxyribonuclease VII small subunit